MYYNKEKMLTQIIFINGIYDILCALSILQYINIPVLENIHLSMFIGYDNKNKLFERCFAYWIFTYGMIRLSGNPDLISCSYYIEAIFFANECFVNQTIDPYKGMFVIVSSYVLGYFSYT
jgi:hypothetical protein